MSTGSIEEKIIQRQLSKEGLQSIIDNKEEVSVFLMWGGCARLHVCVREVCLRVCLSVGCVCKGKCVCR